MSSELFLILAKLTPGAPKYQVDCYRKETNKQIYPSFLLLLKLLWWTGLLSWLPTSETSVLWSKSGAFWLSAQAPLRRGSPAKATKVVLSGRYFQRWEEVPKGQGQKENHKNRRFWKDFSLYQSVCLDTRYFWPTAKWPGFGRLGSGGDAEQSSVLCHSLQLSQSNIQHIRSILMISFSLQIDNASIAVRTLQGQNHPISPGHCKTSGFRDDQLHWEVLRLVTMVGFNGYKRFDSYSYEC